MRTCVERLLTALSVLLLMACNGEHEKVHSVYYWSTTFRIDSAQQQFISGQDISRIYLRYFDVVVNEMGEAMPNATVRFQSAQPKGVEIVPTVYIMNDCMAKSVANLDSLILQRVMQMSETNDIGGVREIQIDCDWTRRTQDTYFAFLERLAKRARDKGIAISATIRLHQLSQRVPPVDRGVLMMYNTGDVRKYDGTNPILDMKDVAPYLRHLAAYDLPLATAYPVFAWRVLFRNKQYVGIMHSDDELPVLPGDTIMVREPSPEVVKQVRQAVDGKRRDANDEVILFDISETNIQRINQYHYEEVFSD